MRIAAPVPSRQYLGRFSINALVVSAVTFPTREYLDLIFAYFGDGEPPPFPHFPHRQSAGLIQVWNAEHVPCNYLQSFENSMDEVHVAFTHQSGGSHAKLSADLPIITAEETDWGMLRFGTRKTGKVRQRAIAEGRPPKQWKTPPAEIVPTLGF